VKLGKESIYTGNEITQEMPKIQWVSEKNTPIEIVMNDGTLKKGIAEPDINKVKESEVIQFFRFGFCRLDNDKNLKFYFTHR
ncbi:MAG: hypothetical protein GF368_04385, partial [Candidatus Aenigmarchaeota archaeon]|nr:hypothetical protein [Candidatus Aenigmarchaeota archaeon]